MNWMDTRHWRNTAMLEFVHYGAVTNGMSEQLMDSIKTNFSHVLPESGRIVAMVNRASIAVGHMTFRILLNRVALPETECVVDRTCLDASTVVVQVPSDQVYVNYVTGLSVPFDIGSGFNCEFDTSGDFVESAHSSFTTTVYVEFGKL